jgi:hypothetical protein
VPNLIPIEGESEVEASRRHMEDPACSGCHQLMDPIGWGLDRYAADGSRREATESGEAPVLTGSLVGFDVPEFAGGVELGQKIAASEKAVDCAVQQVFRWSFARAQEAGTSDSCLLDDMGRSFRDSANNLPEMIIALVQSDQFRYLAAQE